MPEYLERLLFDDIPYLKEAQREHDAFADCLRQQGVEVVYLRDLVAESITDADVRADLIRPVPGGVRRQGRPAPGEPGGLPSLPCRTRRWCLP